MLAFGATVPGLHSVAVWAPVEQKLPTGQLEQPACESRLVAALYEPAAHGNAALALAGQKEPASHGLQAVAPAPS